MDEILPVFPLPNAVFFPRTVLPLHVFEPRYRELVRDAAAGNGRFVVALLHPGYEPDYAGSPRFHALGTVGRMRDLRALVDGRFLLDLVGIERVRLTEVLSDRAYRKVSVVAMPERPVDESDPEVRAAKTELLAAHALLLQALRADEPIRLAIALDRPLVEAVNLVCSCLPVEPEVRQRLLEEDEPLRRAKSATATIDRVLQALADSDPAPPPGAPGSDATPLN